MKLHLPKGLRTALLAVIAVGAAFTSTAQAVNLSSSACVFKNLGYIQDESWGSYEKGTVTTLKNNIKTDGYALTYMPDANVQDWTLTVDAYNLLPAVNNEEALGALLFSTSSATVDMETGDVTLDSKNAFSLFLSADGDVRLATTGDDTETLRNNIIIGNIGRDWTKDLYDAPISLRLILDWDADGGQPHGITNGRYGSLTLRGAYILSNESDHAILSKIDSVYNDKVLINNYDVPNNLFGWTDSKPAVSAGGDGGQVKVTLRSEGKWSTMPWVGNAAWVVTGETSLNALMDAKNPMYSDTTKDGVTIKRALGSVTYKNPDDSDQTLTIQDHIQFTGTKGALLLTAPIATGTVVNGEAVYTTEYQLTNQHPISFEVDYRNPEVVAGFGATQPGLTLRVDIDVLETTALSQEACGLRILGTGTTVLEIDNTGLQRRGLNLSSEVEAYKGTGAQLKAEMESRKIETAGLRFQEIRLAGDTSGDVYCFAIKQTDQDRAITFTEVAEASTIKLAPKGNGNVILNLHTSKISKDATIIMVDESRKVTSDVTTYADYMVPLIHYDVPANTELTTPQFVMTQTDATNNATVIGAPKYKYETTAEGVKKYAIQYKTEKVEGTENQYQNVAWTDGRKHWYMVRIDADGKHICYQYTTNADGSDPQAAEGWRSEYGEFSTVHSNTEDTTICNIELEYQPQLTTLIQPQLVVTNGVITEVATTTTGVAITNNVTVGTTTTTELWDTAASQHPSIEQSVAATYTLPTGVTLNEDTRFARPIEGTDMHINLFSSAVDSSSATGGHFENTITGGDIIINGRKAVYGKIESGEERQVSGILSYLEASSLKTSGSVVVKSNLKVNEDIHASGMEIHAGTTEVNGDVIIAGGNVYVSSANFINQTNNLGYDKHGATLIINGKLEMNQNDEQRLFVAGGAQINKLDCSNTVYVGLDDDRLARTPESWLTVNEAKTPGIHTPWMRLTAKSGMAETIIKDTTHIYYDVTPTVKGSERNDITNTKLHVVRSGHLASGTMLELMTSDAVLYANVVDGTDVYLADTTANATAAPLVTNLRHEGLNGQQKSMMLSYSAITSTGKLSADQIVMPDKYSISAARLNVGKLVVTGDAPQAATFTLTRNSGAGTAPADGTVFTGVNMKDAVVTKSYTTASEITATSINLGEGYTLNNAKVRTVDGMTVSDNATLTNITLTGGDLTTFNNVTLNNMSMTEGKFKTLGSANINNMTLGNMKTFGGADGEAFSPIGGDKAKMTFDAKLTKVSDTASTLSLTKVSVDATGHDFGVAGQEKVEIVSASGDNKISVENLKKENVNYEVQPYTYANVDVKNGVLYLVGNKDEEGIKNKLVAGSPVRRATMDAIEEALEVAPGGVLAALHDDMGMVMKTSNEHRQQILEAISGASLTALADSQRRGVSDMQNSLRNRIIQLGGNPDWENGGIQAWAQAEGSFSTTDSSDDAPGYDYDTWGATVGASIDLGETVAVGMAFSASYGEITSDHADRASGNNDTYYLNLFARHQTGRWTQMLILTAGMNEMDMERTVGAYTAESETEGSSFSAYYEVGYTLGLNEEFTHIIQPIVSARITSAKVDAFEEKGSIGNAGLSCDEASYTYGSVGIGLRYQGVLYESVFERNAVLEARAMISSDFGDATDTAEVALGAGTPREVSGTDTTGTGYDLGVGISIPVEMQTTVFADADVTIRPDYTGVRANIGLRYDF